MEAFRDEEDGPVLNVYFGHCVKCYQLGIVTREWRGPEPDDLYNAEQVFPVIYPEVRFDYPVPDLVRNSYIEARKCHSAGAFLATAVMIRRTLEAVAKNFEINTKNLYDGLKKMKESGIISEEFLLWGTELRFLGNIGAHATEQTVSQQDVTEALEFTNAIIETIYHLRPKFERMRLRRHPPASAPNSSKPEDTDNGDSE